MTEHDTQAIEFFVEGEPVPKQSFRVIEKRSGKTHGYTDPKVTAWQNTITTISSLHIDAPLTGKVAVVLRFYLSNNRVVDLDNLSKGVLDGLKGVAFKDDNQVVKLALSKEVNKDRPGVLITVEEL